MSVQFESRREKCPYCNANGVHNCQSLIPQLKGVVAALKPSLFARSADVVDRAIDRLIYLDHCINGPMGWKAEHRDDMEQMMKLLRETSALRNERDDANALIADMEIELRYPTNPENREGLYERAHNKLTCETCGGYGEKIVADASGDPMFEKSIPCPSCNGRRTNNGKMDRPLQIRQDGCAHETLLRGERLDGPSHKS